MAPKRRFSAAAFQADTRRKTSAVEGTVANLEVTVSPWGSAFGIFETATKSTQLWQLQLRQAGPKPVTYQILGSARRVLLQHPNSDVRDLKTLEEHCHIRLLNGAPPQTGPADPDSVGLESWMPVIYCAGDTPMPGLDFIKSILHEKDENGELSHMPECVLLHVEEKWPFGELPTGWSYQQTQNYKPFSAAPPRGKRHLLMQVERGSNTEDYCLMFMGNLYAFREQFEENGVTGGFIEHEHGREYVRTISVSNNKDGKRRIEEILHEALSELPVYLINATEDTEDAMVQWLQTQRTVHFGEQAQCCS